MFTSFFRRTRRLLLILLLVAAVGAVAILTLNMYIVSHTAPRIITAEQCSNLEADCILVLGAGIRPNGTPSDMLRDRLLTAIDLYESGPADKLLMSGDNSRASYDEASVMKNFAADAGVPTADIFRDFAGFSTYESIYRAQAIFGAKKIIIVTQEYHLYRALYIAEQFGLEAYGVAAARHTYAGQIMRDIREAAARIKDILMCIVKPEPTYLGDPVPVSGNADEINS